MVEKKTTGKKREVVEMMLTGADRTSLITDRMKRLYENNRAGNKEGQSETASPEGRAVEVVQEEIGRTPQKSIRAVRNVSRISERVRRVHEARERKRIYVDGERRVHTGSVSPVQLSGEGNVQVIGQQMGSSGMKRTEQMARSVSVYRTRAMGVRTGRTTENTTRNAVSRAKQVVVNTAKSIYHGFKSSAAMIASGGGVAVLVILIVSMAGMIFGSAFGIFFAGSQNSKERTIHTVMRELDAEYDQQIVGIQNGNEHDILEMHGVRPEWKEVLAVYAVKTSLDPNDSDELITMTKKKEKKLRDVFWDMVRISSKVEIEKRMVTTSVTDESGNVTEKTEEKEVVVLTIRTTNRSANEMAVDYGFDPEKEELLKELLDSSNDPLWAGVIY